MGSDKAKRIFNQISFCSTIILLAMAVIFIICVIWFGLKGSPFSIIFGISWSLLFIVGAIVFSIISLRTISKRRKALYKKKCEREKSDNAKYYGMISILTTNIVVSIFIFLASFFIIDIHLDREYIGYGNGFYYDYHGTDKDIYIRGLVFKKNTKEITVPEYIKGHKVTGISTGGLFQAGLVFSDYKKLEKVNLPETITYIGGSGLFSVPSFENCKNLKTINIPAEVTSIGGRAFQGCVSLTQITIPYKVEHISSMAFDGCVNLIIYVKGHSEKPLGWHDSWCSNTAAVVWNTEAVDNFQS